MNNKQIIKKINKKNKNNKKNNDQLIKVAEQILIEHKHAFEVLGNGNIW